MVLMPCDMKESARIRVDFYRDLSKEL